MHTNNYKDFSDSMSSARVGDFGTRWAASRRQRTTSSTKAVAKIMTASKLEVTHSEHQVREIAVAKYILVSFREWSVTLLESFHQPDVRQCHGPMTLQLWGAGRRITIDRTVYPGGSACKAPRKTSLREASKFEFSPAGSTDRGVTPSGIAIRGFALPDRLAWETGRFVTRF